MPSDTPVLMIALQIPVLEDTSAEQVLAAIGQKVAEAIAEIKDKHARETSAPAADAFDPEAIAQAEFNASVIKETLEPLSESSASDLLAAMGYPADV